MEMSRVGPVEPISSMSAVATHGASDKLGVEKHSAEKPAGSSVPLTSSLPISPASPGPRNRICLFMIVKNEADKVRRFLDSTLGHVSHYCISDTGSTDGTQDLIKAWYVEHGLEKVSQLCEFPWTRFGEARSRSLQNAIEFMQSLNLFTAWFLTMDADHVLQSEGLKLLETPLDSKMAVYSLQQRDSAIRWFNFRLFNSRHTWRCVRRTHEYWDCPTQPLLQEKIHHVWLKDFADGSSRTVKHERDLQYLKEDLADMPNDERSWHYLGQTYWCLKKYEEAKGAYLKRVSLKGSAIEHWQSLYRVAECYYHLNSLDEALEYYIRAYNADPARAEPLLGIGRIFLDRAYLGQPKLYLTALKWLRDAKKCRLSGVSEYLFLDEASYLGEADYRLAICYWRLEDHRLLAGAAKKGILHCDRAILSPNTAWSGSAQATMEFYIRPHPAEFLPLITPREWGWRPMNPSVVYDSEAQKYHVILRTVNYLVLDNGSYGVTGPIRTRNHWQTYDLAWNLLSSRPLAEPTPPNPSSEVVGVEDVRLLARKPANPEEPWYATASSWEYHDGKIQQVLLKLWPHGEEPKAKAEKPGEGTKASSHPVPVSIVGLKSPNGQPAEKNWLMLSPTSAIHGYSEGEVMVTDLVPLGAAETPRFRDNKVKVRLNLSSVRGSAGPIPFSYAGVSGYLIITHMVHHTSGMRKYWHRWLFCDSEMTLTHLSYPFYFMSQGIEYVSGMSQSSDPKEIILTMGWRDHTAYVLRVKREDISLNEVELYEQKL